MAVVADASHAGIITYNSRAAFDAAAPGLPVEDFENLTGAVCACGLNAVASPVSNTTNQLPIAPGDILLGISFGLAVPSAGTNLILLNPNFAGVPSNILGPDSFFDKLQIM